MTEINEAGETIYRLNIPQREGKEGYVGMLFSMMLRVGGIMADHAFTNTDLRIEYMTHFLIALVPGKRNRKTIRDGLNNEIKSRLLQEGKDNGSELNDEQKARIRNMVCLEYIGEVIDFTDKHVGVSSENKIGFCISPPKQV